MTKDMNHKPRFKIKVANRARFFIFISLSLSILLILIFPAIMYAFNNPITRDQSQRTPWKVSVIAGDTIWDIAKEYLPPEIDIRDFVHEIKTMNNLESPLIKEGDVLYIPGNS